LILRFASRCVTYVRSVLTAKRVAHGDANVHLT